MSSGLFTKLNLSEDGLNAKDSLQKLYGPQIEEDISLFAFASSLESTISSSSLIGDNQIYGLVNKAYVDGLGNDILRTQIFTNGFTFSEGNSVWFDRIEGIPFDQRGASPTAGAPIYVSDNGVLVRVSAVGTGTQYDARGPSGNELTYPATVSVNLLGMESGSADAVVNVTVNSDGRLSRSTQIVSGGTGYTPNELLQPIPACGEFDNPVEDKCIRYPGNALYHNTFESGSVGYQALFRNERYTYTVRSTTQDGFFLYDEVAEDWLYLGTPYNSFQSVPPRSTPSLQISRLDTLSSKNLTQLYRLNGRSQFFSYSDSYRPEEALSENIREISLTVESVRNNLSSFVQNVQVQSQTSGLGTPVNRFSGLNIVSDYRVVVRDPDGVLDDPSIGFLTLRDSTSGEGQVKIGDDTIPGIWLFTGQKYQRIFSGDDKPFFSQSGLSYLSPILTKFDGSGGLTPALETGNNKYSISAGLYKPEEPFTNSSVRGFNTILGILVQNLSADNKPLDGGFVYHRTLAVQNNIRGIVDSWPLFSYRDNGGTIRDASILAI
jgi:hypothetical protein